MGLVRRLPTCVKLVSLRGSGTLISSKRTFAAEAKQKKVAVITGASRFVYIFISVVVRVKLRFVLCRGIGYSTTKELYKRLGRGSTVYGTTRGSPDQMTGLVRSVRGDQELLEDDS